jgi:hypothetical protein
MLGVPDNVVPAASIPGAAILSGSKHSCGLTFEDSCIFLAGLWRQQVDARPHWHRVQTKNNLPAGGLAELLNDDSFGIKRLHGCCWLDRVIAPGLRFGCVLAGSGNGCWSAPKSRAPIKDLILESSFADPNQRTSSDWPSWSVWYQQATIRAE